MTERVLCINYQIVIAEIFVAGIVRRIDIDKIDFTCVSVSEGGKRFEVVALDKNMIRSIGTGIGQCSLLVLD